MNQSSSSNVNDDPANNQDEQASHIYIVQINANNIEQRNY